MVKLTTLKEKIFQERGQAMIEYALVLTIVSIVAVGVLTAIGGRPVDIFSRVSHVLDIAIP